MKKAQWITLGIGCVLIGTIFIFGKTVQKNKPLSVETHSADDGHDHGDATTNTISIDSILLQAKKQLSIQQVNRLSFLENSITRGDVKDQQLKVYHQLSHFWGDSIRYFPPYAWYEAEAARLENSEKTLTFAAHLFLEYLQQEPDAAMRRWCGLQAKDLFERSLKINPANDSARVGLGASYLFGNISPAPMEGLTHIRSVIEKDSTNSYARMTLIKGQLMSGQFDKAISNLTSLHRIQPDNLDPILLLAEVYERNGDKKNAADWYQKSLPLIKRKDVSAEVEKRINELRK